jgi:predicted enzyme related to lactoylglutathione lyase
MRSSSRGIRGTDLEYAVNWLVTSVSEAVERILEASGKFILEPTQIPVGRLAVAARSEYRDGPPQGVVTIRCWD